MILLLQYTLIFSAVLILVALGGMFSERSGIAVAFWIFLTVRSRMRNLTPTGKVLR